MSVSQLSPRQARVSPAKKKHCQNYLFYRTKSIRSTWPTKWQSQDADQSTCPSSNLALEALVVFRRKMAGSMVIAILQCFLLCINFKLVLAQFTKCQTIDRCSCETDYGEISLWKLAGTAEGGKPR